MADILFSLVFIFFAIGTTTSVPTFLTPAVDPTTKNNVPSASENITLVAQSTSVTAVENSKGNEIEDVPDAGWEFENTTHVDTRRILYSKAVGTGQRPYMVYLQLTKESAKAHKYRGWLCGGVIVDRSYVLTSAACVEDADRFYVVSGTNKFVDSFDYKTDQCVCNNRRRVVWKCVPKNYKFDFQDSIKWSANDIAIIKVDKPFKFGVTEKGCQFAANFICYNNISRELEKPGTKGYIAGWGSQGNFREGVYRKQQEPHETKNAKCLQQAKVCLMDNEHCAKKWAQKFRSIITQYMICTKDVMKRLSEECDKRYANCTDVEKSRRDDDSESTAVTQLDLGRHLRNSDDYSARRMSHGGFCENDHGGPLIVKYKGKDRVIGVISACKIDPKSHSCHGPFLYTSVFKNRQFISCSIHKDVEESCRRVFRTGITHEEWDVNWDDVEESDQEEGSSKTVKKNDNKSSDSDENNKDTLRDSEKSPKNQEKENKDIAKEELKVEKPKPEKKEKKSSKKHKKSKPKSKSHKSSSKKKEELKEKDAASYQSSKDEDVNEPDTE